MRIISASVSNFGSIKNLNLNLQNRGLQLIQGPTGSGKSTICDIIPWILFGKTAKNGSVDEVRSWATADMTSGTAYLTLPNVNILITRTRHPNDLYFVYQRDVREPVRGKDLADTQRLINDLIGTSADTFIAASYFHEFSKVAQFFTADAKTRKFIMEQIVDLSFAKNLQTKISDTNKTLKKEFDKEKEMLAAVSSKIETIKIQHDREYDRLEAWAENKLNQVKLYKQKSITFDEDKHSEESSLIKSILNLQTKIYNKAELTSKLQEVQVQYDNINNVACSECGSNKNSNKIANLLAVKNDILRKQSENEFIATRISSLEEQLLKLSESQNTYSDRVDELENSKNPHKKALEEFHDILYKLYKQRLELSDEINNKSAILEDLEQLSDVTDVHRALTVKNTLLEIEKITNALLTQHFDAELTATFTIEDSDKMEVSLSKDNNPCSYTQLSKGQRCLLKLCFGWAIMKTIASHSNVSFNTLFFDEALDGLDDNFKIKAYKFLSTLALDYENIFIVDHNEALKSLFESRIDVQLVNGETIINEQT